MQIGIAPGYGEFFIIFILYLPDYALEMSFMKLPRVFFLTGTLQYQQLLAVILTASFGRCQSSNVLTGHNGACCSYILPSIVES
jgi:hypothetical protein